jgi:SAM-dependent methyltransferase
VGRAGQSYGIHRQLWGPGVTTPRDASNYVNVLLEDEIRALAEGGSSSRGGATPRAAAHAAGRAAGSHTPASSPPGPPGPTILDLGCGVGGTLFHLAKSFPRGRLVGVTISERQVDLAHRLRARLGLDPRCDFQRADFQTMRLGIQADVAIAIESFVHSERPEAFFATAAAHLRPGGRLFLVDDFQASEESTLGPKERRGLESFRAGWRAVSLCTAETCARMARASGLELLGDRDLSPLIRLGRPRDHVISWLTPLFSGLGLVGIPFFANMIGGDALQTGLRQGFLEYRMLSFAKGETAAPPAR